jgi:hypothetical protein
MKIDRKEILAIILGTLLVCAGILYYKGYWNTWEDFRQPMAEATNECVADFVVEYGTALGCQPWNDPQAQFKACIANIDPMTKMIMFMQYMSCFDEPRDKLEEQSL